MNAPWVVLKFGGASVATAAGWDAVARLVRRRREQGVRPIVVHSAVAGVTDQLETLIELARRDEHAGLERELGDRHRELAREMNIDDPDGCLGPDLENLAQLLRGIALTGEAGYRARVKVLALGERLAGRKDREGPSDRCPDACPRPRHRRASVGGRLRVPGARP